MPRRSARRVAKFLAALVVIFSLFSPIFARAQSLVLSGSLRNNAGRPVASAVVTLSDSTKRLVARSDARGRFHFTISAPGTYTLGVAASGFLRYKRLINIAGSLDVAVTLEPSTLPVIGSVMGVARTPFNSTPLAQRVFPREAYRDQGQPSVTSVLDQTPGAIVARSTAANDAAPIAPAAPLVRGGLPFETPVSLDGSLVSLPSSGSFDLALIPTYVLQEVEVLQGPGDPAGAGGGVGGALNLRTAEPTLPVRAMLEVEGDSRGGQFSDLAYDGTLPGGKFAFATMASIDGSPGSLSGTSYGVPSDALRKALLLKLRMTPDPFLTVTANFLGVNLQRALGGVDAVLFPNGSVGGLLPSLDSTQFETLRFGQIQARLDHGTDGFDAKLYGLDLANSAQSGAGGITSATQDKERGAAFVWRHQATRSLFSLSLSDSRGTAASNDVYAIPIASGSDLNLLTLRGTATLHPTDADQLDLSAEGGSLAQHAAPNGTTFNSYTWAPTAVRAGYSHSLGRELSLRAAVGASGVTPPLMALSGGPAVLQQYVGFPMRVVGFTSAVDRMERANGEDVGAEWRLHGETTTFSADWYRSNTYNAYVLESEPQSQGAMLERWFNGPPMVDEGVQFSLVQFKPVGMGFIAQMAFPRTYVSGPLPPGFYANGNLAVIPGQNVSGGAFFTAGENDVAPIRVPYAVGYGEISYKWPRGSRLSLGALYEGANNPYAAPAFVTFNSNLELSLGPKAKFQISVENLTNELDNRLPFAFQGIGVPLAAGGAGLTNANALQPRTFRFMLRQSFGGGAIYEH
jgi:hypothetical protein